MKENLKKLVAIAVSVVTTLSMFTACGSSSTSSSSGNVNLTYAIWDKNQLPGMQAIADKFHEKNPNITVKVEVTPWDQYWTKLDAAASSGTLPDVFWMHSQNFLKYATNGALLDITDKIKGSKDVQMDNFPKGLVDLYSVQGKNYSIPKDYDTIGLWYNKKMFDEKGIPYPDETWDWNKLVDVAQKLTDSSKGVYGYVAPEDGQQGFYPYVYQNGGYILSPDKKKSGYDQPATKETIQWFVDLSQKYKVSPTVQQLADTNYTQFFTSGKAAMAIFGSWMVSEFKANDYVRQNCNVAVIPHGKTKATIYNGLGNAASAKTKHPEEAWKFLEFMGTKEANEIQAQKAGVIPAYKGTEQGYVDANKEFNVKVYPEMLKYSVIYPNSETRPKWVQIEMEILTKVWAKQLTVEEGCNQLAKQMNDLLATEKY
ncbi:sugar ABC transporter substrate-binding protein [Clostridium sp. DJ247]|uniref:ABC transporter substrate-binding protein n=1 Tax=Clostridium sp. DJ247 TaxID=2726188 RepID=UPI0016260DCA|nr:sugar ABC transporter substrate-binding protein [Clostridium sp. DJ247]MBC2580456.1 sugar ABC transporter substrate-binding protein [Clostridium sp. DJ247]